MKSDRNALVVQAAAREVLKTGVGISPDHLRSGVLTLGAIDVLVRSPRKGSSVNEWGQANFFDVPEPSVRMTPCGIQFSIR